VRTDHIAFNTFVAVYCTSFKPSGNFTNNDFNVMLPSAPTTIDTAPHPSIIDFKMHRIYWRQGALAINHRDLLMKPMNHLPKLSVTLCLGELYMVFHLLFFSIS
jgi:hypothetical protein